MTEDQNRLRTTFDGAALLYDEVRPGYPEELFDDVVALSGIPSGGRVLEIGCGTGHARHEKKRPEQRIPYPERQEVLQQEVPQPPQLPDGDQTSTPRGPRIMSRA